MSETERERLERKCQAQLAVADTRYTGRPQSRYRRASRAVRGDRRYP
jgi:hypothetical protein